MGRGYGGYNDKQSSYKDSGGQKVTDPGSIFVAERYMDAGYEAVFRRRRDSEGIKTFDLTIKTSDDTSIIKHIEVKRVTSNKPSQIAKNIEIAKEQIKTGDTVAIYLPHYNNSEAGRKFAQAGIEEAKRKGDVIGPIEVWFADKTRLDFPKED
ncbi:MAG: hypothetical protein Q4F00_10745 [bacterium]|nr:hypothetical protein [bacterium]